MLRSRFLWKLYAGYAFLILLACGLVGVLVATRVETETLADIDRRLEAEAWLLQDITASAFGTAEMSRLQERVEALGHHSDTRFTILDAEAAVLADSGGNPGRMGNHGDRPEILQAATEGRGSSSRFSSTQSQQMRYLALPVKRAETLVGYVRVSLPLTVLSRRLGQLRGAVLLAACVASMVALVLGFLHARRITRPLLTITDAASAIAAGDYAKRVDLESRDELDALAQAFNAMGEAMRQTLATLKADRNKLSAILASMEEGVIAVDREERIVHMNEVAARLLEIESNSEERYLWEVARIPELSETLTETLDFEEPVHRVIRLPAISNSDRILDIRASPLEAGGVLAGAVMVLVDVTQIRRLENMRRDFFGNVSHELKTPVAAIRGIVETMLEDPEMDFLQRHRFLGKVSNQADRLSNLVSDLLSLTRLESGGVGELMPIEAAHVLEDALRDLRPTADRRRIELVSCFTSDPLTVSGEEETLRQAVGNLLDNAIKYTPEGGRVTARAWRQDDQVWIEITDTGLGIETQHLGRIFERFYRVDKARSRAVGGTGLGLAIVKHSVLAMGGEVTVKSTVGRGTTFHIRLPWLDEPEEFPETLESIAS